jgi:hypothetical protein
MAIDLKRTHSSLRLNRPLTSGTIVEQEGLIMVAVLENGIETAGIAATAGGSDIILGFSATADSQPTRTSEVEDVTVPSAPAALEVDLRNQNLVTLRIRAVTAGGLVLTIDETFAGSPGNDTVKVDLATGRLKFHPDEAGATVTVTYLYDLTLTQSKQRFGERFINNRGLHAEHGSIEAGAGHGELWTDQYNAALAWDAGTAITLGDAGQLTQGGPGPAIPARVVSVPSTDNPFLGISFSLVP